MAQPLRIEDPNRTSLITSKTRNAKLWFINNPEFEEEVLAYLGKYVEKYEVELYANVIQGNHFHLVPKFPKMNRTGFMKAFNAAIQRALKRHEPRFESERNSDIQNASCTKSPSPMSFS